MTKPRVKTINLPYATWKQLKLLAIDRDLTMHQLVQAMLDEQPKPVVDPPC